MFIMKKFILIITAFFFCFSLSAASYNKMLKEWNSLSEDEKWLCLLTEPFLSPKNLSLTTVNPEPGKNGRYSIGALEDNWGLHSKNDVLNLVERYKQGKWGENPYLMEAKAFYEKYPNSSVEEISKIECLGLWEIVRLYFYAENKDKIGGHGFLALDIVRLLSVIRWGVGAGWLTESEAVETAKPLMTQLLNAYDSWEDFAVHFAVGWYYYTVNFGYDLNECQNDMKMEITKYKPSPKSTYKSKPIINHDIKFPAKDLKNSRILVYDDVFYTPSEDASKWYLINRWYRHGERSLSFSDIGKVGMIMKEKADVPAMACMEIFKCAYLTGVVNDIPGYIEVIEKASCKSDIYHLSNILYGLAFLRHKNAEQIQHLMESQKNNKSYQFLAAFYNLLKLREIITANKSLQNIDLILSDTDNCTKLALENMQKAKSGFPKIDGYIGDLFTCLENILEIDLFGIYSDCAYMYYEAHDLNNSTVYLKKAEEKQKHIKEYVSQLFKLNKDIESSEKKLDEVRKFVNAQEL